MGKEPAATTSDGFLAIWSDVATESEVDYLHWLTREHTQERLGVTGFTAVRVFRLLRGDLCRYFIRYALRSADVLSSHAYLSRLNDPTPWSQRIMPSLGNFIRGGGTVRARAGSGQGGLLAIAKFNEDLPSDGADLAQRAVGMDGIAAAQFLETDHAQTSIRTQEKELRNKDQSFAALLLIEGVREQALTAAVERLGLHICDGIYAQTFELRG